MPYLRFSRDGRGYENTYVFHTAKKDGKTRPRMLYWFRTPPSVKVGRVPLDEEAIRAIEGQNPDVVFDWKRMLKLRATRQTDRRAEFISRSSKKRRHSRELGRTQPESTPNEPRSSDVKPMLEAQPPTPTLAVDAEQPDPDVLEAEAHLGSSDDTDEVSDAPIEHPVITLLGDETLVRLRARHAEIRARIKEKVSESAELSAMLARAEPINPDRWNTIEAAVRGIERFEVEVGEIRADLGRRPPRSRRVK